MAYASRLGRARINARSPQAAGQCDRCGLVYTFTDLHWQFDWRGASLQNLRLLVCDDCLDVPQEQLRAIVLPSDPTPIINARPTDYVAAETDFLTVNAPTVYDPVTGIPIPPTTNIIAQNGANLTNTPYGQPVGLEQDAVMPLNQREHFDVPVHLLSVTANGTPIISVTTNGPHGLATNDQIAVEGLANNLADGFFSVTVTTATAFTYTTANPIHAGSLLTATTLMVTALVGLPYGYDQIPQVGP